MDFRSIWTDIPDKLRYLLGMIKLKNILLENRLEALLKRKGEWILLSSSGEAMEIYKTLIDLVKNSYKNTQLGSFLKYRSDVGRSQYWEIINIDDDPEPDVCVFGRKPGSGEHWKGIKLQGLGHDGERISKDAAIEKVVSLLNKGGFWIEASDAVEKILRKHNVKICGENGVSKTFPHGIDEYKSDGSYIRSLPNGVQIHETSFGDLKVD